MQTKIKAFDAVAESRKWREATSRKLNAMSREERIAHLKAFGLRLRSEMASSKRLQKPAPIY